MSPLQEDIEFLEHFGKKGMHWGVRNAPKPTPKTQQEKRRSAVKKVAVTAAVSTVIGLAGAQFAAKTILGRNLQLNDFKSSATYAHTITQGKRTAEQIIRAKGNTPVSKQMAYRTARVINNSKTKATAAELTKLRLTAGG